MLAKVIVDLAVWGLNRELTYAVPEKLEAAISVGSVVRVPLRNRRVRGWVVGLETQAQDDSDLAELVPLAALSGRGPVFDDLLLGVATKLARRYVHPLSSFLTLFTPPRLGRPTGRKPVRAPFRDDSSVVPTQAVSRTLLRLGPTDDPVKRYGDEIDERLDKGMGTIVVVPEVREGSSVLGRLAARFPADAALVHSGLEPSERAKALWSLAEGTRRVALGGRAAIFAPPFPVGLIVVHGEHDASLKEQRSPYYDARVVAQLRADAMDSSLLFASRTPSLSLRPSSASRGDWSVEEPLRAEERHAWPVVELVHPARRRIPQRVIAAIVQARARGRRIIVLVPRVSLTPSGPGPAELEALLGRIVPGARITRADRPGLGAQPGALEEALTGDIVIATEAALAEVERPQIGTAIALGVDSLLRRPRGRAAEETVQALWALAVLAAGQNPKGRLIIETSNPDHHVIQAVVRGDHRYFAARELQARQEAGVPPFKSLVRIQVNGRPSEELVEGMGLLPGTTVLGPSPGGRLGWHLLLKVDELEAMLDPLNDIVATSPQRALVEVDVKDW